MDIPTVVHFICLCVGCIFLGMGAMLWLLSYVAHQRLIAAGEPGLGFEWWICGMAFLAAAVFFCLPLFI